MVQHLPFGLLYCLPSLSPTPNLVPEGCRQGLFPLSNYLSSFWYLRALSIHSSSPLHAGSHPFTFPAFQACLGPCPFMLLAFSPLSVKISPWSLVGETPLTPLHLRLPHFPVQGLRPQRNGPAISTATRPNHHSDWERGCPATGHICQGSHCLWGWAAMQPTCCGWLSLRTPSPPAEGHPLFPAAPRSLLSIRHLGSLGRGQPKV